MVWLDEVTKLYKTWVTARDMVSDAGAWIQRDDCISQMVKYSLEEAVVYYKTRDPSLCEATAYLVSQRKGCHLVR